MLRRKTIIIEYIVHGYDSSIEFERKQVFHKIVEGKTFPCREQTDILMNVENYEPAHLDK